MAPTEPHEHDDEGMFLVEPFEIDDGELDGLTPEQCFTLGVEWEMCWRFLQKKDGGFMQIHAANLMRIMRLAPRRGIELCGKHVGEGWATIEKEGRGTGKEEA